MEQLLKNEIVGILNEIQRGSAPHITGNDIAPAVVNISDHKFDLADSKGGTPIRNFEEGSAHYINGNEGNTYSLKILESRLYFIVHELSDEISKNKIRTAKKQLSDTLNQLYKSAEIAAFIDGFQNKLCFLSADDSRKIVRSEGMADGFSEIYRVLPEPLQFNFGQIGTHGFKAFETSYVNLPADI